MQTSPLVLTERARRTDTTVTTDHGLLKIYDRMVSGRDLEQPTTLVLKRVIGHGGQGPVFLAENRGADSFEVPVAVKIFSPERFVDVADYESEMKRIGGVSAQIARIRNECLVGIHHFQNCDGVRVMTMDWIEGFDLRRLLTPKMFGCVKERVSKKRWEGLQKNVVTAGPDQPRLRTHAAISVLLDCLRALTALHQDELVHGDVKPANLMVNRQGKAMLVDVGAARDATTQQSANRCTPTYASPAVLNGGLPTPASDLVSLGYSFIEWVSGCQLFAGDLDLEHLNDQKLALADRLDDFLPMDLEERGLLNGLCRHLIGAEDTNSATSILQDRVENSFGCEGFQQNLAIWIEELLELDGGWLDPLLSD